MTRSALPPLPARFRKATFESTPPGANFTLALIDDNARADARDLLADGYVLTRMWVVDTTGERLRVTHDRRFDRRTH